MYQLILKSNLHLFYRNVIENFNNHTYRVAPSLSIKMYHKIIGLFIIFTLGSYPFFAQHPTELQEKKMIVIPKGSFDPFFKTVNNQLKKVASFQMDEYAVTNLEYLAFVTANPEWRKSKVNRLFADKNYLSHWDGDLDMGRSHLCIAPVVNVSWFAAQAFAKWKGKRLPTVAEWEYAGSAAPKNIKFKTLTDFVLDWYRRPNPAILPAVKSTYQNVFGLYDMHGLVWEWTFDFNNFISSGDSRGGNTDELQAFCAAGSIDVKDKTDYAGFLRFSYRGSLKGNFCIQNLGFRCSKNI